MGGHAAGRGRAHELLISAEPLETVDMDLRPSLLCSLFHAFSTSRDVYKLCSSVVHSFYPKTVDLMSYPCCARLSLGVNKSENITREHLP